MTELPKNFPEYSLMYKTLNKKIQELKNKKDQTQDKTLLDEIQRTIEKYQKETNRIKSMFPEKFFDNS